jgi:formamidopyrimidine-DNA glycosylase
MVEGPQNAFMAKRISKRFKHRALQKISVQGGRYKSHPLKNLKSFQMSLPLQLKDVYNKGKVLFLFFSNDWVIIVKFGMTGWFYMEQEMNGISPDITFNFGDSNLYFQDTRHFGTIQITKDADLVIKELEKIAPDILDNTLRFSDVEDRIRSLSDNATIDTILMDQSSFVSGVGNIIKSEVLYDSKLSPKRRVRDLNRKEWMKLFQSTKKIAENVYHEILKGSENEFQQIIKIYQRDKDPKGNKVEKITSPDGRVTFWVPTVQN